MLKTISIVSLLILFVGCSNSPKVPDTVDLATWQDSVSYSIGNDVGSNFLLRDLEFEVDAFNKGFLETISKDTSYAYGASMASNFILQGLDIDPIVFLNSLSTTVADDSLAITKPTMRDIVRRYNQELREQAMKRQEEAMEETKVSGQAYIKDYIEKHDDEIVTESGLVYRVLEEGFGDTPSLEDRVIVQYVGTLTDGTVFDSSIDRGEPATFRVSGVIQGWQEALTLMKVGSKWELVIPSTIAYGERTTGNIPGMSTLVFEVELLGIE